MLETNIQEKLNTVVIPEGRPSPEIPIIPSETSDSKNIVQPVVDPLPPIQSKIQIEQEASVISEIKEISVDSGTSWKTVIESKEQGVEPSEL
jgi:hypothetical protein